MAARKLQTEIDRTLKKVSEGVESFESIYDKMKASTNQTQKEKSEADLKTQIKKLQRLRDQIKSWVASSDIKDKSILLENRKLIETQMEKFKACEKEMKTKAFSKEGLTAALKLDPKAQEKHDCIIWLQSMVDDLGMQVEAAEAEIETLQGGAKKKGKTGGANERLENLEHLNERRKWHVSRLELILRLLENGSLQTDKVLSVKEDVKYYVESNTEEDFDEDEAIYDEMNLEEEEGRFGIGIDEAGSEDESIDISEDLPPRTPMKDPLKKPSLDDEAYRREDATSPVLKKAAAARKVSNAEAPRPVITANFAQQPMATVVKASMPMPAPAPRAVAPVAPPMRYSAAAAGSSSGATSHTPPATSSSQAPTNGSITSPVSAAPANTSTSNATAVVTETSHTPPSPSFTHATTSAISPILSSVGMPSHSQISRNTPPPCLDSRQPSPAISEGEPAATSSPHRDTESVGSHDAEMSQSPTSNVNNEPSRLSALNSSNSMPQSSVPQVAQSIPEVPIPTAISNMPRMHSTPPPGITSIPPMQDAPNGADRTLLERLAAMRQAAPQQDVLQRAPETSPQHQGLPNSLSDLLVSFESAKQKAATRMTDLNHVHKILEAGYSSIPQPRDAAKPKYYIPRHPYQTPNYYPQTPHPILSAPAVFSQIDVETLFYIFYFLPGTYQQYLAAKELKKQSWRFHVKYLTWFQRHSEPQAITDEYEQGVYVYFDWEGSWCQRKKSDFRFEYRYLSED